MPSVLQAVEAIYYIPHTSYSILQAVEAGWVPKAFGELKHSTKKEQVECTSIHHTPYTILIKKEQVECTSIHHTPCTILIKKEQVLTMGTDAATGEPLKWGEVARQLRKWYDTHDVDRLRTAVDQGTVWGAMQHDPARGLSLTKAGFDLLEQLIFE
jgi:hypothetical protein